MAHQKPEVSSLETLNTSASGAEHPPCTDVRIKTEPVEEEAAYASALDPASVTSGEVKREVTATRALRGVTRRTNTDSQGGVENEQSGAAKSQSDGGLLASVKLETNVESQGCGLGENSVAGPSENSSDYRPEVDVKQEANLDEGQMNETTTAGQSANQSESGFVADVKQERKEEDERGELTDNTPQAGQRKVEGGPAVRVKQEKIEGSDVGGDSTVVMRGDDFVVERVHSDEEGEEDCKHSAQGRSFPANVAGPSRSVRPRSGNTSLPSEFSGRQVGIAQGISAAGFPQVSRVGNARQGQSMRLGGNVRSQTQRRILPRSSVPAFASLLSATGNARAGNSPTTVGSLGVQSQQGIPHRTLAATRASQTPTVGSASSGNATHQGAGLGRQTQVRVEHGTAAVGVSQPVMTGSSRLGSTTQRIETSGQLAQAGNVHADSTSTGASQTSRKRPLSARSRDIAGAVLLHELAEDNDLELDDDDNDILLAAMLLPFLKLPVAIAYLLAKRARYDDDEDENDGDDDDGDDDNDDDDDDDDDDLESETDDDEYDEDDDESDEDAFESDEGQSEDVDVGVDDFDFDDDYFDIDIDVDGEEGEDEEEEEEKKKEE